MKKLILPLLFISLGVNAQVQKLHEHKLTSENIKSNYASQQISELSDYDVKFYGLDIELSNTNDQVAGHVIILIEILNSTNTIVFELIQQLTVDSIFVNETKKDFTHANELISINNGDNLNQGDLVNCTIYYRGTSGEGLTTSLNNTYSKYVTASLSESFHAKDWFPCKQDLNDKADSVYVFVTTADNLKVGSNGLLTQVVDLGNGKVRHEWKSFHPIVYYLISVAVSDYEEKNTTAVLGDGTEVLIQNYVWDDNESLISEDHLMYMRKTMEFFSEIYGNYPFADEKYGHAMWNWGGGMEHQTMSSMVNFGYTLMAHEMAHQWFGDYVTCASWQDIWINEGFATYSHYLASAKIFCSSCEQSDWEGVRDYIASNNPYGSVYLTEQEALNEDRIFEYALSYLKGAYLVRMLQYEVNNDDLWFEALRNYLDEFKYKAASGDDFKQSIEATTGIDFTTFFDQWYYGYGYPKLNVDWSQEGETLSLDIEQTTSSNRMDKFVFTVDAQITGNEQDTLIRLPITEKDLVLTYDLPFDVEKVTIDPNRWILLESNLDHTGLHEFGDKVMNLYPNPNVGHFYIKLSDHYDSARVELYNYNSELVYKNDYNTGELKLEITATHLPKGVYIAKITIDGAEYSEKVFVM